MLPQRPGAVVVVLGAHVNGNASNQSSGPAASCAPRWCAAAIPAVVDWAVRFLEALAMMGAGNAATAAHPSAKRLFYFHQRTSFDFTPLCEQPDG